LSLDRKPVTEAHWIDSLFFFHPAIWFLSRRLDQEREKAQDVAGFKRATSGSSKRRERYSS